MFLGDFVWILVKTFSQNNVQWLHLSPIYWPIFFNRLSQAEKLTHQMNQMHKDHNEDFSVIQEAIGESKRKQEQALENVSLVFQSFLLALSSFSANWTGTYLKILVSYFFLVVFF